jgi:hypothetical protein
MLIFVSNIVTCFIYLLRRTSTPLVPLLVMPFPPLWIIYVLFHCILWSSCMNVLLFLTSIFFAILCCVYIRRWRVSYSIRPICKILAVVTVRNRHHHHISVTELGHLLTRSGLTCPEASSKVCHGSFCQSGSSVWGIVTATFLAWTGPWSSGRVRLPEFQDSQHVKVVRWFLTLRTDRLYTLGDVPVRGWVTPGL